MTAPAKAPRLVEPVDPDSATGKRLQAELGAALADVREAIAARHRHTELADTGT